MTPRAVLYARCSTEEESQKDALVKQVAEAEECIHQQGWVHVDSYVESRSGTTTKGRNEYNRLCDDLEKNRFDIIVIKSQDRLMRNTMEWYLFVNRLTSNGKRLYIYIEQKFYTADDSLITGIKAILAEDYSRELSKKINNAHRNRQKNGGNPVLTSNTYGYRKLPDKSVEIIPEEAAVKKRMYELCAAGYGGKTISMILQKDGILNRKGKPFSDSDIIRMIRNPINRGAVCMNRQHYDFDSKKIMKNPPEEQYIYENKIPAIVTRELWQAANQEIDRRAQAGKRKGIYRKNSSDIKYPLSGKICCGVCGSPYYRSVRKRYKDGGQIREWKCSRYLQIGRNTKNSGNTEHLKPHDRGETIENTENAGILENMKIQGHRRTVESTEIEGCNNVHVNEDTLCEILEQIFSEAYQPDKEQIVRKMIGMLRRVLKETDVEPEINKEMKKQGQIKNQMNLLVDKLLDGVLSDEVYRAKQKELEQHLELSKNKVIQLEQKHASECALKDRIEQIEQVLQSGTLFEKASTAGMMDEIETIKIYPTYLEITFNIAGMLDIGVGLPEADGNTMRFEYGSRFNYLDQKRQGREAVVEMMRENPQITARMIAERLGISLSGANYQIRALKKEGKVRFHGKGGRGVWEVL